jgi:hypothetical protein
MRYATFVASLAAFMLSASATEPDTVSEFLSQGFHDYYHNLCCNLLFRHRIIT